MEPQETELCKQMRVVSSETARVIGYWVQLRAWAFSRLYQLSLWDLYTGLEMAWKKGYKHLILEIVSQSVLESLLESNHFNIPYDVLITKFKSLLKKVWVVEVNYVFRDANSVAEDIANWAILQSPGEHLLNCPPREYKNVF